MPAKSLKTKARKKSRSGLERKDHQRDAKATSKSVLTGSNKATGTVGVPIGSNGKPMIEIVAQAAETVPTEPFGNVICGPIAIRRWIEDTGKSADVERAIAEGQGIVQNLIADDRERVEESLKEYSKREEEAKKKRKS